MKIICKNTCTVIFVLIVLFLSTTCQTEKSETIRASASKGEKIWLKNYEFDAATFNAPPQEYGPYTRWWWPGNDVTSEELKREINVFAENGFAGIEIQSFTRGLNPNAKKEELDRVYSWDTPEFYNNIRTVLEQAKSKGLTTDLNGGSGWPSGGPHISQKDNILNLGFSAINVTGGEKIQINVPQASMKHRHVAMMGTAIQYAKIDSSLAKLVAIVAARILQELPDEPVHLDPNSTVDLSGQVSDNKINWDAPAGNWKIIAFWSYPAGEIPC